MYIIIYFSDVSLGQFFVPPSEDDCVLHNLSSSRSSFARSCSERVIFSSVFPRDVRQYQVSSFHHLQLEEITIYLE